MSDTRDPDTPAGDADGAPSPEPSAAEAGAQDASSAPEAPKAGDGTPTPDADAGGDVIDSAAETIADAPPPAEAAETGGEGEPDDDADDDLADVVQLVDDEKLQLRDRVATLEAQLRTVSAAWKEKESDLARARERIQRQAALREELRRGEVVGELFDPVENLKRSLDALEQVEGTEKAREGLQMVLTQFMTAFKKLGLEEVPGKGATFDPNLHEALTVMPVTDPALDNVVVEVFATGYRIGSRLIRPARVVIGQMNEDVPEA